METCFFKVTDNSVLSIDDVVIAGSVKCYNEAGLYIIQNNDNEQIVRAQQKLSGKIYLTMDNCKDFKFVVTPEEFDKIAAWKVLWVCKRVDLSMPEHDEEVLEMFCNMSVKE